MSIASVRPPSASAGAHPCGRAIASGSVLNPQEKAAEKSQLMVAAFKSGLAGVPASVQLNAWGGAFSTLFSVTADEAEEIAAQLQAAASRVRSMNAGMGVRRAA